MKKLIFLIGSLIIVNLLEATPTGNPSFPKAIEEGFFITPSSGISFRLGYEGNFVTNRRLKQDSSPSRRVNNFSIYLNSGIATINLLNRLDVFGTFGKGRVKTDWIINEMPNAFSYLELQTKYDIAWSVGTKIIFFEWGNTILSVGGRYFYTDPKILWYSKAAVVYPLENHKIRFEEWQVDIGLSHKIDIFIPYICAKYSKAKAKFAVDDTAINSDGSNKLKMKSKNLYGMALGCMITTAKYFMLNLEVRMVDEEAFTVSGEFKF